MATFLNNSMQFKINLEGNREETIIETCKNV